MFSFLQLLPQAGHVACTREMRNAYIILLGKPERKRLLGRPRHRWEGNIRMDLGEIESEGVDWMNLVRDRDKWWPLLNTLMNLQVSYGGGGFRD
jgi:hypothetical protein